MPYGSYTNPLDVPRNTGQTNDSKRPPRALQGSYTKILPCLGECCPAQIGNSNDGRETRFQRNTERQAIGGRNRCSIPNQNQALAH